MNFIKQHFFQLLTAVCVAFAIVFIALSIAFLCKPVYKGTYEFTSENNITNQITFYDNTYTTKNVADDIFNSRTSYGFYTYFKKSVSNNINYDTVLLSSQFSTSSGTTSQQTTLKRNSVFSLTLYSGNNVYEQTYVCTQAIFAYIGYWIGIIVFVVVAIFSYKKYKNQ